MKINSFKVFIIIRKDATIAAISSLHPHPQVFFQDTTLLINSNDDFFYQTVIEAVK
jgi:hypothetical protein